MTVSDNLRSGITKACFYEPAVNRSYAEMAAHYDTAIIPARPRKPRDKAKVEAAVLLTWCCLNHHRRGTCGNNRTAPAARSRRGGSWVGVFDQELP